MTEAPWGVFDYELHMFKATLALCKRAGHTSLPTPITNAVTEALLLHIRNLCDMLLSRGTESDEITLRKLLPDFSSTKIDELKNLYGHRSKVDSPCWMINKRLVHSTLVRSDADGYNYSSMVNQLTPVLLPLIAEVQEARGKVSL